MGAWNPSTVTSTPPSKNGSGMVLAFTFIVEMFDPKIVASEPGATRFVKLAASVTAVGVGCAKRLEEMSKSGMQRTC